MHTGSSSGTAACRQPKAVRRGKLVEKVNGAKAGILEMTNIEGVR